MLFIVSCVCLVTLFVPSLFLQKDPHKFWFIGVVMFAVAHMPYFPLASILGLLTSSQDLFLSVQMILATLSILLLFFLGILVVTIHII